LILIHNLRRNDKKEKISEISDSQKYGTYVVAAYMISTFYLFYTHRLSEMSFVPMSIIGVILICIILRHFETVKFRCGQFDFEMNSNLRPQEAKSRPIDDTPKK